MVLKNYLKLIRIDNYIKNLLIFLPAFFQPKLLIDYHLDLISLFCVFSISSSIGYVINDLVDSRSDKLHPQKKSRPLASGALSIFKAYTVLIFLFTFLICFTLILGIEKLKIIYFYLLLNFFYTFYFKNLAIFDVCILSIFYTLRIILGATIIDTDFSLWLISFSYLFFLNLSSIKRLSDINQNFNSKKNDKFLYKNYSLSDYKLLKFLIPIFLIFSLAILFIYITYYNNLFINKSYGFIFLLIIFLWNLRIIKKTFNDEIHSDPITFILKDKYTYICSFIGVILFFIIYLI